MTLILENGSGVAGANSYVLATFVSAYLTDRGREAENGWTIAEGAEEDEACIAGTDYVENRFRSRFGGLPQYRDISLARSTLSFTAQPGATETVTIGTSVYRFMASLSAAGDVQIGASTAASIANLVDAVQLNASNAGTTYHAGTVANTSANAEEFIGDTLLASSKVTGTAGNAVATTTTVTGASWNFATLVGGSDIVEPQPLSFPRTGLVLSSGGNVQGIPLRLKWAIAEYSVRSRLAGTVLAPDPTVDATGGTPLGLREKVGPIETETTYVAGTAGRGSLPPYPAADRLLAEFLVGGLGAGGGGVIRG